jgi:hypothetical protein
MDINRFLIFVYTNYLNDGSYNQEKYDYKIEKVLDLIAKKEANWIDNEINKKVEYYKNLYIINEDSNTKTVSKKPKATFETNKEIKSLPTKEVVQERIINSNLISNETSQEQSKVVESQKNESDEKSIGYSSAVDSLIDEIEAIK